MSRRPFVALAAAEVLSLSGTRLSTIAIPWLVLTTTGDPVLTGVAGLAEMLPYVIAKALGGPMIDRLGARLVSLWCDAVSVFMVALIPLLDAWDLLTIPVLLPIVAAMGVLRGPSDAAKQSLVPEIARIAGLPLERVTGTAGAIERLASTAGAAGAGTLIAVIGAGSALMVNAVTFALAAAVVAVGIPGKRQPAAQAVARQSYAQDLTEGWNFLRREPVLFGIVLMVMATNLLDQAYSAVLLPVWVQAHGFDAAMLGAMLAVFTAASIAGAVLAAALGERLPRLLIYTSAFLICGLPRFAVFAFDVPLAAIFVVLTTGGFASGFLNPILSAINFERIPAALVGRVIALIAALSWSLIPFGGVFGGALIAGFDLTTELLVCGVLYFAATLMPLMLPSFRQFDQRPARPARPESHPDHGRTPAAG